MRTEIERRPVVLVLAGLVVGLSAPVFLVNLVFGAVGLAVLRGMPARFAVAIGFCVGGLLSSAPVRGMTAVTPIAAIYTVASSPSQRPAGGSDFLADGPNGRLQVTAHSLVPVLGDEILVQGEARPVPQQRARTYFARGVNGVVVGSSTVITVVKHSAGVAALGAAWREAFIDYSRRRLAPKDAAVATALAFDVRTGLNEADRTALERSGTVHVLAASGLQLLTLAWLLELIGSRLPVPLLVRRISILGVLVVYSSAAGFHPGTFRAVVSAAVRDGALVLGREYDALSAVAVAGVLYLLWQPTMVFDAGFQLSMVIGAGIALFRARSAGMTPLPRLLRGSFVAWLVSVPLVAQLFGVVSIVAVPANLIAASLLPVCLLGLLASHAASYVSSTLADVLLAPATLAGHGLEATVRGFGGFRAWGFAVPAFSGYWLAALYGAGIALWRPKARPVT
ncbi:MAG: ComEC/Rec2 family competence protein [Fimbriimonadaceae bacterium]